MSVTTEKDKINTLISVYSKTLFLSQFSKKPIYSEEEIKQMFQAIESRSAELMYITLKLTNGEG